MAEKVEAKVYGSKCSLAERETLLARVKLEGNNIISYQEVPVLSEFQVNLMFDKVQTLADTLPALYMLVDLTEAKKPTAKIRKLLRERLSQLKNLKHIAIFTGKNFLITIAVKFVFGMMDFVSLSAHSTKEDALLAIKKAADTSQP